MRVINYCSGLRAGGKRLSILLVLLLGACAVPHLGYNLKLDCEVGPLRIESDFPMANISRCTKTGDTEYSLTLEPEQIPINPSAWYAFRLVSTHEQWVTVVLQYEVHKHRYPPRISRDRDTWSLLDPAQYRVLSEGKRVELKIKVGPEPTYIAAQEIIDNDDHNQWITSLDTRLPYVEKKVLGASVQGRLLYQLTAQGPGNEWVLIVGRQHPPEVTGAMALRPFVETLLADSDLARQFRHRYNLLIIPNMNPDGVAAGHWRYNMNGVDLNRDWGTFHQPETKWVSKELDRLFSGYGQKLMLGLDFHSTKEDIFYTQEDGASPLLPYFTRDWLGILQRRVPEFKVKRKAAPNSGRPVFKQYISEAYGIPAITYEMGDQTDRQLIVEVAEAAALALMQILLEDY